MSPPARRCLLAVFAHPDDETSAAAGTLIHYAREGVDVYVVTATRGEHGDLGTGDLTIARQDLPAVREAELRAVLALYGAHPPILLDYRDQELRTADCATLTHDVWRVMVAVQPEVVLTFGPTGISGHEDHQTVHRVTTAAFHRYRPTAVVAPRLYYVALPPEVAAQFAFRVHPSELTLSVCE
jgi:LmbE family N-acetylglucosaminyl deacetylase